MPTIDLDKFFNDPKHEQEKNWMTSVVNKIIDDREKIKSEESAKNSKNKKADGSFFDSIWSGN